MLTALETSGITGHRVTRLSITAATKIRRRFGLEAAQTTLGHVRADVTQVDAERDYALAARAVKEVGQRPLSSCSGDWKRWRAANDDADASRRRSMVMPGGITA